MTDPTDQVPWPNPPREPGPWAGGPPVAPPGNTALPPLPGPDSSLGGPGSGPANAWTSFTPTDEAPKVDPSDLPSSGVGRRRPDRSRAVAVLGVVAVLALIAGVAYVMWPKGPEFPDEWDKRVDPIARWVAKERKLEFEHPVEVEFLPAEEYKAAANGDPSEANQSEQEMSDTVAELRALGMVSGEVDLEQAGDTLSDSGTLAFYDPSQEKVFVRGTTLTPGIRVTLAHELVHVLQDQHFDLGRLSDLPESQAPVLRALAEGDAGRVEDAFVADVLTRTERAAYEKESQKAGDSAIDKINEDVPPVLTAMFASPYVFGPSLIDYLLHAGGEAKIDGALADPPTEKVLFNPLLHRTKAAAWKPVSVKAPNDARVVHSGDFGPTAWYLMLASRLEPHAALQATDGLGGDAYTVYRTGEKVCVRAYAVGEDKAETNELRDALEVWVAASPKDTASVSFDEGLIHFQSCDPGPKAPSVAVREVSVDLFALPVGRTQTYLSLMESGADDRQATCLADAVVGRFSFEQLTDEAFLRGAAAQATVQELASACRR